MSDTPQSPAHPHLAIKGLIAWLLLQLAALALGSSDLRLSMNFPAPPQNLAIDEMLIVQIAALAMLFPLLLADIYSTLATWLVALPFLLLASFLALTPWQDLLRGGLHLTAWMATLWLWRRVLKTPSAQLFGAAAATLISLGGPILWFLKAEFVSDQLESNTPIDGRLGPVMGNLSTTHHIDSAAPWAFLAITFAAGLIAFVAMRCSRQLIHMLSTKLAPF